MSVWGKIKNILFEDDEEVVEEMPVYTKEDVEEKKEVVEKSEPVVEEKPIEVSEHPTFNNVKRDIYMPFEDDELEEIPAVEDKMAMPKVVEEPKPVEPKEEKKSPFLSFDEDEFERLNSRVSRNENREERKSEDLDVARRANSNYSSTTTTRSQGDSKINSGTLATGKKPFTPSPVISPVYGILGENYKKDDIVDKKDGMKREKIVKPIIAHVVTEEEIQQKKEEAAKKEQELKKEEPIKVNIDSVRQKAYGSLNKLEEEAQKEIAEEDTSVREKPIEPRKEEVKVEEPVPVKEEVVVEEPVVEEVSVEDQIENEEPLDVTKILEDDEKIDEIQNEVISKKNEEEVETVEKKPRKLDDIEKTSTLQILDDIEKELNSIKPITKNREEEEEIEQEEIPEPAPKTEKEKLESNDTLENDLFNLIDSMYEEGEEEEDNG